MWLGVLFSAVALYLALRRVDLGAMVSALAQVDVLQAGGAALLQLAVVGAIAQRWALLFDRRPRWLSLARALLVAQLANNVLPLRIGILVRAYLVGREAGQSRVTVLATVVAEKVFESLAFLALFSAMLPYFASHWLAWSALGPGTLALAALLPALLVVTYQRRRLLAVLRALARRLPWTERLGVMQRLEAGLDGLLRLHSTAQLAALWLWTLAIMGLGVVVNYLALLACGIHLPVTAAAFLLVALQIGSKVVATAPLGGIGIFQYVCMEALAFLGVERNLGLAYGFVLYFIVRVPGSVLGAAALYPTHMSLRRLERSAGDDTNSAAPGSPRA